MSAGSKLVWYPRDRVGDVVVAIHDELFDVVSRSPLLAGIPVVRKSKALRTMRPGARWERMMSLPARRAKRLNAGQRSRRADPSLPRAARSE